MTYPELANDLAAIRANNAAALKRLVVRPQVNRAGFDLLQPRSKKQVRREAGDESESSAADESEGSASDESEAENA